jgi:catechol 2,3-dioxygenase-like lactoylglutathione lyase family enzyme
MRFADLHPPGTPAATAALQVAERYCSPALLAHSVRSWAFALAFAEAEGISGLDEELLYVASLVHDLGLVPAFDAVRVPFETAGGEVGWVLAAGAGWDPHRRQRVVEVVERHMQPSVNAVEDPEGHLLEIATGLDISGARADVLPKPFLREVLTALPRGDLAAEFGACLVKQAGRKPGSQAARIVASGLESRLAANPLESST